MPQYPHEHGDAATREQAMADLRRGSASLELNVMEIGACKTEVDADQNDFHVCC